MDVAELGVPIPSPEAGDPDDVATALETANALWGIGQRQEALRLLRRAAETAEDSGNDLRSVRLARAAADVATQLQAEVTAAAARSVTRPPPPPSASVPPREPTTSRTKPPAPAAPAQSTSPRVAPSPPKAPPAPSATARPRSIGPTPSMRPTPPSATAKKEPAKTEVARADPAPLVSVKPSKSTPAPAPDKIAKSTPPAQAPAPSRTPKSTPAPPKATAASVPDKTAPGPAPDSAQAWHAVRVSIKVSARDPNLFVVRRLENGNQAPPGTRQALVMLLDPDTDFGALVSGELESPKR